MEVTFEEACEAVYPYLDSYLSYFENSLKDNIFAGDEVDFLKRKHQFEMLSRIRQTTMNNIKENT